MDYQVKVRVRNGRIVSRMRELGIDTLTELADRAGVHYSYLCNLVNLKETALDARGNWRSWVLKIAVVLESDPYELFNEQQRNKKLRRTEGEAFLFAQQVEQLADGGISAVENRATIDRLLDSLDIRERFIVERRLEGEPIASIAKRLRLGSQRTHQLEKRAHSKMRKAAKPRRIAA